MKKLFLLSLLVIGLAGCDKETKEVTTNYALPPELKNCKFFNMTDTNGAYIKIVRCPNSDTSTNYRSSKSSYDSTVIERNIEEPPKPVKPKVTITINGETYVKEEK